MARKCDRCGTYHDGFIHKITVEGPPLRDFDDVNYDLCAACKNEFDEFMKGTEKVTGKPLGITWRVK
jgi:hypothetical protein